MSIAVAGATKTYRSRAGSVTALEDVDLTAVDGERTLMEPGDFVITPSMTWHDHSNETSEPMFWLDGLDIPMVQFFDASFAEGSNEDQQKISKPAGDSFARYGHNLLPVDGKRSSKTSPIFNYPYSHTREALEQAKARNEPVSAHFSARTGEGVEAGVDLVGFLQC